MCSSEKTMLSVRIEQDTVDRLDKAIIQAKADGDLPFDTSRAGLVRQRIYELVEELEAETG